MTSPITNQLWNLPARGLPDRYNLFSKLIGEYLGDRFTASKRASFLEIGVWKASTLIHLIKDIGPVFDYVGIDPYGKLEDDYYLKMFWQNSAEADEVYEKAKKEFERYDAKLIRETAQSFFSKNDEKFDVIFVDGDHTYKGCLDDCEAALNHLKENGLLIVDDYGNNFHPEVEWAIREFTKRNATRIKRAGCHPLFFQLDGMFAPVMLSFICFEIGHPRS